jgi:hypothetical protein
VDFDSNLLAPFLFVTLSGPSMERFCCVRIVWQLNADEERVMGFGKGALLWLIGVPLPIILLLALFMHH